ncbi:hypothetical protein [Pseudazoarcus pumilus]|uniref:Uncharacterized protein n=1 Tax=Pseudazoarcus pumilus TaxID=2067960 RepID=A0A2I6S7S4_9RHOO|nr:hypothetical protein [Pseudazoarcus pumilus]AUN95302.1 hypothetical protein C0099_10400 [Pseudazoarcus pumilus]
MNDFRIDRLAALLAENWPAAALVACGWAALMIYTLLRGGARWRPTRPLAVFAGIVAAVSALFTVPLLADIPFGAFADRERWSALFMIAVASGAIAFAFAWPAAATAFRSRD